MARYYPAPLEPNGSGYSVVFPDLPGCVSAGDTISEAIAMAEEALALHLAGMIEDGDPVPEPGGFESLPDWLTDDPEVAASIAQAVRVLIRVDVV